MPRPTIAIRMLNTGDVKQIEAKTARLLVACKKARYVSDDDWAAVAVDALKPQSEVVAQPKRRGRPPKAKSAE